MEKALSMIVKKATCSCMRVWDFFEGHDQVGKPDKGNIIHSCKDLDVYQNKIIYHYVRKK